MDFALSAEHDLIRESAAKFGQQVVVPDVQARDREARSDRAMLDRMAEAGLLGVGIPSAYGGPGADYLALGIVCEELERADSSARVVMSVHSGLHALTLLQWGTEEQRKRWLPAMANGSKIGAFGLTEPNAGSDAANLSTRARKDGESYVLNGEKTWISLADYADQFLVIARLENPAGGVAPYVALIVDRDLPGFSSKPLKGKLGVRAGNTGQIFFENVRVPADARLGEDGDGFKVAMSALDHGRYTVASGEIGR